MTAAVSEQTLLGVERSLSGRRWMARGGDERLALALAQRLDVSTMLGRLLAARGVTLETAESFLTPSLRDALPDPSHLLDMDRAVARLVRAIAGREGIAVFGDYDVDGATSSALLLRFFKALGVPLRLYVPDRLTEGYGPNVAALKKLRAEGIALVITVDCGVTAHGALEAAAADGLEVIVIDHHAAEPRLPPAAGIVNPNRLDESSPHRTLAAVGVTFLLLVGLNRALRQEGFYTTQRPEPDLRAWLDLVALGTVCDVVPLTGLNRVLVAQGLKVMEGWRNVGLKALAAVSRLDQRPQAWHLGFLLGPRVNAGGRVGRADLGARLLSSDNETEAAALAAELDQLNNERRAIENDVFEQALTEIQARGDLGRKLLLTAGEGWHPGVIGVVAGRLKERFSLPALVIAFDGDLGKGSGRSVAGVDLGQAVIAARQEGLLVNGGGHAMAAGLTVSRSALPALEAFLGERVAQQLARADHRPALSCDSVLQAAAATPDLIRAVERLAPFGVGNPAPRYVLPGLRVKQADVVGGSHVRCYLEGSDGTKLKAIAFRAMDGVLGATLLQARGRAFAVAGRLELDLWGGGERVSLQIEDLADV